MEMDKVIVAFESPKSCERVREIIESSGTAACIICRSAAEVKRTVSKHHISTVVCGFKLPDESAQSLFEDLPPNCAMLMVAVQGMLDLCQNDDIFLLASPVSRGRSCGVGADAHPDGAPAGEFVRPQRSEEEMALIDEAKSLLMERHGMTEEQAIVFCKKSMDSGAKMVQTAKLVLGGQ
ncbi:MAG: ANTAR domain-containing response regulator [Intestinimonas sp.]